LDRTIQITDTSAQEIIMASVKKNLSDAAQNVAEKAKNVGQQIADGAEKATDWVKEKAGIGAKEGCTGERCEIKEHMDVIGSCGNKLGEVDRVEGGSIKLTRKDSPDNQHHFIPMDWVDHVDSHVHLNKDCGEAKRDWNSAPLGTSV